jgi:hypothetical protein
MENIIKIGVCFFQTFCESRKKFFAGGKVSSCAKAKFDKKTATNR